MITVLEVLEAAGLRRIMEKFLVLSAMALRVGLAGVKPLGKEWAR